MAVARDAFPALPEGQHYLSDLLGSRVVNRAGESLGEVKGLRASEAVVVAETAPAEPHSGSESGFEHVFEPAFDPYSIGAVVTLQRLGPAALMDSLCTITSVENLISLARAQNLSLKAGWSTADELRAAIVSCAEQRLEEKRLRDELGDYDLHLDYN